MDLREYEELDKLAHEMYMLVCLQDLVLKYGETLKGDENLFAYKGLYKYLHEKQAETMTDMNTRIRKSAPIEALTKENETINGIRLR